MNECMRRHCVVPEYLDTKQLLIQCSNFSTAKTIMQLYDDKHNNTTRKKAVNIIGKCLCRLYWTDLSRNTIESMSLQSMLHRVEDIPLSATKTISDVAVYKASELIA